MEQDPGVCSISEPQEFTEEENERVKFLCVHFSSSHKGKQKERDEPVQIKPGAFTDEL